MDKMVKTEYYSTNLLIGEVLERIRDYRDPNQNSAQVNGNIRLCNISITVLRFPSGLELTIESEFLDSKTSPKVMEITFRENVFEQQKELNQIKTLLNLAPTPNNNF